VKSETIPQWADGLYYNKGVFDEVLVYYDDGAVYCLRCIENSFPIHSRLLC
jgi:hypothetical protein